MIVQLVDIRTQLKNTKYQITVPICTFRHQKSSPFHLQRYLQMLSYITKKNHFNIKANFSIFKQEKSPYNRKTYNLTYIVKKKKENRLSHSFANDASHKTSNFHISLTQSIVSPLLIFLRASGIGWVKIYKKQISNFQLVTPPSSSFSLDNYSLSDESPKHLKSKFFFP